MSINLEKDGDVNVADVRMKNLINQVMKVRRFYNIRAQEKISLLLVLALLAHDAQQIDQNLGILVAVFVLINPIFIAHIGRLLTE